MTSNIDLTPSERRAYQRFIARLQRLRRTHWAVEERSGQLRMQLPYFDPTFDGIEFQELCPITADCFAQQRGEFEEVHYQAAGKRVGISRRLSWLVVSAADGTLAELYRLCFEESREALILKTRRDLLRATGQSKRLREEERELKELLATD